MDRSRTRWMLAFLACSLLCALFAVVWPRWRAVETREEWQAARELQMQRLYEDVQQRVEVIEAVARELGDAACTLLPDDLGSVPEGEERVALLEALRALQAGVHQEAAQRLSPRLARGIGVQLFDPRDNLLAWTGPALLETTTRRITRFQRGERQVYFRQGGVHTFLSYDRQDGRGEPDGTTPGPRVVVDVPVQVASRLPQRHLSSWSLADEFSGRGLELDLNFDSRNLPSYLVTQDIEFSGDDLRGLQAEFVVRGEDGSPRFAGRITESPYDDHVLLHQQETRRVQRRAWALALLLAAAAGATLFVRLSRRRRWALLLYAVTTVWAARFLLIVLGIPTTRVGGTPLLDPQGFAMTSGAGMLRSPLDLLLTSGTCMLTAAMAFWFVLRDIRRLRPGWGGPGRMFGGLLAAALVTGAIILGLRVLAAIATNSSPVLMGTALDPGSIVALAVQVGLLGIVASLLVLAMLATALLSAGRVMQAALALALLVGFGMGFSWTTGAVAVAVWLAGNWMRGLMRDQRFTSFGLAVFALVAIAATLVADALHRHAFRQDQVLVLESADHVRQLVDEVRPFVLERVLEDLRRDPSVLTGSPRQRDVERNSLAFRLWAGSMLGHLGWSSQVRVYDAFGVLASEYSVDMPYAHDTPSRELLDRVRAEGLRVEQSEVEATTSGRVRLYRGAVAIDIGGRVQALVVVDLPFAREDLTQTTTLQARQRGLLRRDVDLRQARQQHLFAWVEDGVVVESSTPYLEVGTTLQRPADAPEWQELRLVDGEYRVTQRGRGERVLWVGFRTAGAFDRLLEWSQVASLYFGLALAGLLLLVALARIPAIQRGLPLLLVPKRIGFQQKLMGAFLVVALLPSLVLSWATRDVTHDRSIERNRDVALEKARSAEAALADLVRREIDTVRESEYLREVLNQQETPPVRDIGHLEFSQIMVFEGNGQLVLDETLSNLSDEEARQFVTGVPGRVFASRDGSGNLNLGALVPVWYSSEMGLSEAAEDARLFYLYYRRRLTDGVLRDLAPILNTDISGFLGPELVVSSQMGMATAGLLPSLVPPEAFEQVQLRNNRYAVLEERVGDQVSFTGYLPLRDRFDARIGSLAVSQFLQQDAFAVESERTRAVVVGLSTLMFVLTLILGVVFASRIFDPVRSLIEGTQRLASGEFGFRLQARAGDEIGQLERSFNDMAQSLQGARRTLEERRRYLEAVLGNVASGVVATDSDGRITATNQAVERILHRRGSSLEGRTCRELAEAAPDSGARALWTRIGSGRDGEEFEVTLLRDGERLTLRVIATDLRPADDTARSLGRVAIFEDVTELIRSKKLSAWAEMARQVAHEIKNPLTPLKSEAQFMERAWRDRSDRFPQIFEEGMKTIIQQVDALRRIASEFSNYGRAQKLEPRPTDLGELLQGVVAPYANMKDLQVVVPAADNGFPGRGIRVLADEEGLRKVFRNVFENARESMQGKGRIEVRVEPPHNGTVQVIVTDEGQGISADAQERLYEPYFSTKSTGTGLGLAITRGILEELGGRITLSNRPQGGAEARVTLVVC